MKEIYEIINENEDVSNKGCLLLDAAVYFPYENQDIVTFDAIFVEDILERPLEEVFFKKDKKYNHRYPNRGYITISKTYGRKVCKAGYPFVEKIDDLNKYKYLCIKFGIHDQTMLMYIPVNVHLTEEKPYSYLTFRLLASDPNFPSFNIFALESGNRKDGWRQKRYLSTEEVLDEKRYEFHVEVDKVLKEDNMIIYKTEIDIVNSPWEYAVKPLS